MHLLFVIVFIRVARNKKDLNKTTFRSVIQNRINFINRES